MFGTPLRILLTVWTIAWFVLYLPGHTRGVVTLQDGDNTRGLPVMQSAACSACTLPFGGSSDNKQNDAPSGNTGSGHCAVCVHMASLETPPPVFTLNLSREALHLAELRSTACSSRIAERVYIGRAPPSLA